MDPRFRVALIAATPNPQQCVYAGMHQDYSEGFVAADAADWPDETKAGEICIKRLLAGERGHYGPLEHAQIVLNVGWFPHSVMQQARTHRVGVSFDVQSMRYTGERICRAARGELELEEVFYLRPVGDYSDRQGKKYAYTAEQRAIDLALCQAAAERYRDLLAAGFAEEHARGILPFDYRQHFRGELHPAGLPALPRPAGQARCPAGDPRALRPDVAPPTGLDPAIRRLVRKEPTACIALAPSIWLSATQAGALDPGEGDALGLVLVLAGPILVGGVAGIALKEEQLADALVGVDAAIGPGGIAELQGEVPLPAGLGGRGVHNDAEAGIGALAQADHGDVGRHPHFFQGHTQAVGVGRQDEVLAVVVLMRGAGSRLAGLNRLGFITVPGTWRKIRNSWADRRRS
jgi:thymidylate synthase (FAD)